MTCGDGVLEVSGVLCRQSSPASFYDEEAGHEGGDEGKWEHSPHRSRAAQRVSSLPVSLLTPQPPPYTPIFQT